MSSGYDGHKDQSPKVVMSLNTLWGGDGAEAIAQWLAGQSHDKHFIYIYKG